MLFRKLNSTLIALTVMTAAGFILSNQQAKAAYTDSCPNSILRSSPCAADEYKVWVDARSRTCATLYFSNGDHHGCCSYYDQNTYCVRKDGSGQRSGGGQDSYLSGTQSYSSCVNGNCLYD